MTDAAEDDEVLSARERPEGPVVRRGSFVHRPPAPGSDLMVALLVHLESVGFEGSPRFRGTDDRGRHRFDYVDGDADPEPPWQLDDVVNARVLGRVANLVADFHKAAAGFVPPPGAEPFRPLPLPGDTWAHGDLGYQNVVFRGSRPVAFIDWECTAPADPLYDPATLLAFGIRGPKPDADDVGRRERAVRLAHEAIVEGYGLDDVAAARLFPAAAAVVDDAADFWEANGLDAETLAKVRWRADWFRNAS